LRRVHVFTEAAERDLGGGGGGSGRDLAVASGKRVVTRMAAVPAVGEGGCGRNGDGGAPRRQKGPRGWRFAAAAGTAGEALGGG